MSRLAIAVRCLRVPTLTELWEQLRNWYERNGTTWAISLIVHVVVLLAAMIVLSQIVPTAKIDSPTIIAQDIEEREPPTPIVQPGKSDDENPPPIDRDVWNEPKFVEPGQTAVYINDDPVFSVKDNGHPSNPFTAGPLTSLLPANGPGPKLPQGNGAEGKGYGIRDSGNRKFIPGPTKISERAVASGLSWLARHQNADGSWSMDHLHSARCIDKSCTGPALAKSDAAATALAVMPFLAYGETHENGRFKTEIGKGLAWLIKRQKTDGDLSQGEHQMYTHGLATITLCEAYGMTQDSKLAISAQAAIKFIETAQNASGGWRYTHGTGDSDLSVFGWQVMALKSGQMAKLQVDESVLEKARGYLRLASTGNGGFSYTERGGPKNAMTAVGLLTAQYLGAKRDDPLVRDGVAYLMNHLPDRRETDIYYWYYATQAMHNVPGPEWQTWNRAMRKVLTDTQEQGPVSKTSCAVGSWNPDADSWGAQGGRLMESSLSCLTLEVYYRYTPLFKLDGKAEGAPVEEKP